MRLRNIPEAKSIIENSNYVIHDPSRLKGKWKTWSNGRPVFMEIGTGKGRFIIEMAEKHQDSAFIGVERYESVLYKAINKMHSLSLEGNLPDNISLLCLDALTLPEYFGNGEIDGIYLNFSDPWPKKRHSHRRLVNSRFLKLYTQFLKPDGILQFKTDNTALFEYALEELKSEGWRITHIDYDLHKDGIIPEWNVCTEYELKFSSKGNPIHLLKALQPE